MRSADDPRNNQKKNILQLCIDQRFGDQVRIFSATHSFLKLMIKEQENRFDNIWSGVSHKAQQYFREKSPCSSSAFSLDNLLCLFLYCCFEFCSQKNNSYCNGTLYFSQTFQTRTLKQHLKLLIPGIFPADVPTCGPRDLLHGSVSEKCYRFHNHRREMNPGAGERD